MNLTGKWTGKYTYGKDYPKHMKGSYEVFELDITDKEGNFIGICIDPIVRATHGNEARIAGSFQKDHISFIKSYKYNSFIAYTNEQVSIDDIKMDGIYYTGHLIKKLFSRKHYF